MDRSRSADDWAALVRHGLLDGAIVSAFSLPRLLPPGQEPRWDGLTSLPLLHQALASLGFGVEQQPVACQEPAAWVKRARDRRLAMPICTVLLGPGWLAANNLVPLTEPPRKCLRRLRVQISMARVMQDPHESKG
ncbi:MAG: hypothetical protein QUV07_15295 [Cyanobium sp. CZS 25K]|nr:hypothetical protein [Cyanobium sp. CZS25K]